MSEIGKVIKDLRESTNMSQDQLAAMIGKTRSAVSQYESGKIVPRMGVIEDIARIYGVPKAKIIGDSQFGSLSPEEQDLIRLFRSMEDAQRQLLIETAKSFSALSAK